MDSGNFYQSCAGSSSFSNFNFTLIQLKIQKLNTGSQTWSTTTRTRVPVFNEYLCKKGTDASNDHLGLNIGYVHIKTALNHNHGSSIIFASFQPAHVHCPV